MRLSSAGGHDRSIMATHIVDMQLLVIGSEKSYSLIVHPDIKERCQEDSCLEAKILTKLEETYPLTTSGKKTLTIAESLSVISELGLLAPFSQTSKHESPSALTSEPVLTPRTLEPVVLSVSTESSSLLEPVLTQPTKFGPVLTPLMLPEYSSWSEPVLAQPTTLEPVLNPSMLTEPLPLSEPVLTPTTTLEPVLNPSMLTEPLPLSEPVLIPTTTFEPINTSSVLTEPLPLSEPVLTSRNSRGLLTDPFWQGVHALIMDELMDDGDIDNDMMVELVISGSNCAVGACLAKERTTPSRIESYVEIVPKYSDATFRSHFRMTRTSFEELCGKVGPLLAHQTISTEKKMLSALWVLCKKEAFRSTADRFNMSQGTLHLIFMEVCTILTQHQRDYIKWPSHQDLQHIAEGFERRCGFPGIVDAIDGTHIPIPGPRDHRDSYINRKGFPSVQLQVVCDSKLRFLDVYARWPGAVYDARVFRNSPLHGLLESPFLPADLHLIGDSAYHLRTYLLVPFRDDVHLTDIEKRFNKAHSSTRVDFKRAIGLLKCKFCRLKFLEMYILREIPSVIVAACSLHNFILQRERLHDEDIIELNEQFDDWDGPTGDLVNISATAREKRTEIANNLV